MVFPGKASIFYKWLSIFGLFSNLPSGVGQSKGGKVGSLSGLSGGDSQATPQILEPISTGRLVIFFAFQMYY
jgi:hypothetical protein